MNGAVPGPVKVVRVDLDRPLPDLSRGRSDGSVYASAYVVAVRGGRPVGYVEVPFEGPVLGAAELDARLAALRRLPPVPVVEDRALPAITVVVGSTFDRAELLERSLASLVAQDYPAFDVVIVDNRPVQTAQRLAVHVQLSTMDERVSVVTESRPGLSAARNAGARRATGTVVAFTDDDVEVESGWLRAIGTAFALDPGSDCVTGLVLPIELETPAQIWFERSGSKLVERRYLTTTYQRTGPRSLRRNGFRATARRPGTADEHVFVYRGTFGMGANIAVRLDAFRALGGFDEALGAGTPTGGGEELQLLARLLYAGRRVTFEPGTAIYHTHRRDLEDLRRRMWGYGSGYTAMLASLVRDDPRHLVGLVHYAVQAAGLLLRRSTDRQTTAYPKALARNEFRGLLAGPWRYLVSRRAMRRSSAPGPVGTRAPVEAAR